ncbi:hypothetical protein HBH46_175590 [Parastagonospora nodorum]|nr:hypothetical protein HBH46_175590 [Parastagonospora nodorum]
MGEAREPEFQVRDNNVSGTNKVANTEHTFGNTHVHLLIANNNGWNSHSHERTLDQRSEHHQEQMETIELRDRVTDVGTAMSKTTPRSHRLPIIIRRNRTLAISAFTLILLTAIIVPLVVHFRPREAASQNTLGVSTPQATFPQSTLSTLSYTTSSTDPPVTSPISTPASPSPSPDSSSPTLTPANPPTSRPKTPTSTPPAPTARAKIYTSPGSSCKANSDCAEGLCYSYHSTSATCCGSTMWGCPGYDCEKSRDNGCLDPYKCATTGSTRTCVG